MQQLQSPRPVNGITRNEAHQMVEKLFMQRSLIKSVNNVAIVSADFQCLIISCELTTKHGRRLRIEVALIEEEGE